jgi:hypothetical protein
VSAHERRLRAQATAMVREAAPVPLALLCPEDAVDLLGGARRVRRLEASGDLIRLEVGRFTCYRWPDVRAAMVAAGVEGPLADERGAMVGAW